ncbi:MAG: HAD-IA family hydrolase [Acidimicrobiia bacterium]|nr:HAD-IA family hydrolase [Acidimicrobiia bacterium]
MTLRAVLWDFGGVISTSPFEAFAAYEREHALPDGFIRGLNAANPDGNAWARLERAEVDLADFAKLFEAEAREEGHAVEAAGVLMCLVGGLRPQMVEAVRRCRRVYKTALLTNNWVDIHAGGGFTDHLDFAPEELFDVIVQSSVVGVRKPEPAFYEIACRELGIEPAEAVMLDDLGINLKPAQAMGMTTIKVTDPDSALGELGDMLGLDLRSPRHDVA